MTTHTKDAEVFAELHVLGGKVPNLVLVQDSGKPFEFRVQCEIPLDDGDAKDVSARLTEKTRESLNHVEEIVTKHIDPGATATFREIIKLAFKDNGAQIGKHQG